MSKIEEIRAWLAHSHILMDEWKLSHKVKPGYRAVFSGPPGTGKTLTAALLGQSTGREVYRVDLSMVVSKYIGETEKNLSRLFDAACYKEWILFLMKETRCLVSEPTPLRQMIATPTSSPVIYYRK